MKKLTQSYKLVFSNVSYILLALIIALVFYFLNVVILSYVSLKSIYSSLGAYEALKIFLIISFSLQNQIKLLSFFSLIATSVLIGILITMMIFKVKMQTTGEREGLLATIGIVIAAVAPGCAACGIGLISALGAGGIILAILPFKGFEISLIAIIILIYANFRLAKDLLVCKSTKNNAKARS